MKLFDLWRLGLAWTVLAAAIPVWAASFVFAAVGDTPYTPEEEPQFVSMIAEINRAQPAFTIHVGDFKSGWAPCTDALYQQRAEWFAQFFAPLVYTPGDNDWTDCKRAWGAAFNPIERIQKVRSVFFPDTYALGQQKLPLLRQSNAYPEHARWVHENIVFATLNVPGSRNNSGDAKENAARHAAVQTWITATFDQARRESREAVVMAFQANPLGSKPGKYYEALMRTLITQTLRFPGEVLLIHGDTHQFRIDKPLTDLRTNRPIRNFTRVEVFGYPFMNWVRVGVTRRNGRVAFDATPGG
jgi:hypothetical protein